MDSNILKKATKKKVLVIAYYFPPMGGGGVLRTAKYVQYLIEFDWHPVVLTVTERIYKKNKRVIDSTLLEDIPKEIHIVRTNSIDLGRVSTTVKARKESGSAKLFVKSLINKIGGLLINPDAQMLWIPVAIVKGLELIRKHKIDIIYSTANPWSDHIIGAVLKKITGLPWVADYRDPWNINPYSPLSSKIRKTIQVFLETQAIRVTDKVIFATEGMQQEYSRAFGDDKFTTIRNGYDPHDFVTVKPRKFSKFTILYSGSIWPYRRPTYFLYAVSNWLKNHPYLRQKVAINFLGRIDDETKSLITRESLHDVVNILGHRPHKECLALVIGANALLLTIDEGGGEAILTGKIFEYLASGRPILALVPPSGMAADLLRKEGRGEHIVNPKDVIVIENHIMSLFTEYKNGCLPTYPVENLQDYTRRKATEKLSKLLDSLKR